jgi:DNA-binding NarL/FixJ family response regulator
MTHILIIEDHEVVSQALAFGFESEGFTVDTCNGDRDDLAARIEADPPDVVILDLILGVHGSGVDLLPELSRHRPVIVLTGLDRPRLLAAALRAGASAVLDKSTPFQTLVDELRAVLEGGSPASQQRRDEILAAARTEAAARAADLAPFERLTSREQEVLGDLMNGIRAIDIAERSFVSLTTVRSQIRAILTKLGVKSQLAAVTMAMKADWQPPRSSG